MKWYLANKVKANRETCKSAENVLASCYMTTPEEKQIDTHLKIEQQMYFSKIIPEVNPVVINYKITHKNWPATRAARYYLA